MDREIVENEISELLLKFKHAGFVSPRLIIRQGIMYLIPRSSLMPRDIIIHELSPEDMTFGFTGAQWDSIINKVVKTMKGNKLCQITYRSYRRKNQASSSPTPTKDQPVEKSTS